MRKLEIGPSASGCMRWPSEEEIAGLSADNWRHICNECLIDELAFTFPDKTVVFDMKADRERQKELAANA